MAIEVSRGKKGDTSAGRYPPESGRVRLQSAHRGKSNGIGFEASAWLVRSVRRKRWILHRADVRQSQAGSHWSPLAKANRMGQVSKRLHGYRGQQEETSVHLTGQMSARVGKGLIRIRSLRGIE